ncbi:hypothetical protein [Rheinheimera hassiensis]|uniref:hypothetical protein n=1 Tax=Rheinheimera hassiensis TaxID=1193627 RepID=UPI001F058B12|nr:hypothetical protein [Rheinheimera hassiensis]
MKKAFIAALLASVSSAAIADVDSVLHFTPTPFKDTELNCERDKHITPKRSALILENYALMAANNGERVALVTLRNGASGQRIYNQEHIVAVLGDCSRVLPNAFELRLDAREQRSLQIYFGKQQQPVLQLLGGE